MLGAVTYKPSCLAGCAAVEFLAAGCSRDESGPGREICNILNDIDRDLMPDMAGEYILARFGASRA